MNPCGRRGSILDSLLFKVDSNDLRTRFSSNTTFLFISVFLDRFILANGLMVHQKYNKYGVIIKGVGWWKEKLPLIDLFIHLFIYTLFNIDKL